MSIDIIPPVADFTSVWRVTFTEDPNDRPPLDMKPEHITSLRKHGWGEYVWAFDTERGAQTFAYFLRVDKRNYQDAVDWMSHPINCKVSGQCYCFPFIDWVRDELQWGANPGG